MLHFVQIQGKIIEIKILYNFTYITYENIIYWNNLKKTDGKGMRTYAISTRSTGTIRRPGEMNM